MQERIIRALKSLELEEKILHSGAILCIFGLLMPWVAVQLYGNVQQWTAFGYHTGYIGHSVFFIQCFIVAMTASPLLGGPVVIRKSRRNLLRLLLSALSCSLIFAAFTVLLRLTFEVSGAEVRFGVYLALVGSVVTTLYSFLRYQEEVQQQGQSFFQHPDQAVKTPPPQKSDPTVEETIPAPPPPPPQSPPEDHHLF